jgi:hypothetical protein
MAHEHLVARGQQLGQTEVLARPRAEQEVVAGDPLVMALRDFLLAEAAGQGAPLG